MSLSDVLLSLCPSVASGIQGRGIRVSVWVSLLRGFARDRRGRTLEGPVSVGMSFGERPYTRVARGRGIWTLGLDESLVTSLELKVGPKLKVEVMKIDSLQPVQCIGETRNERNGHFTSMVVTVKVSSDIRNTPLGVFREKYRRP